MLIILSNITRLSDSTVQSIFHKFWATPVLMYVSSVYTFCLVAICVCMYFNRRDNLIYKVLNLAVLSVFVVALWSYLTDVTFIYVVYILTFVSAVVMLFLSVVLMLPSSAVAVPKKSASYILFAFFTHGATLSFYTFSLIVALIAAYVVFAFYTRPEQSQHSSSNITLEQDLSGLTGTQLATAQSLKETYTYSVIGEQYKDAVVSPTDLNYLDNCIKSIGSYTGPYPVYLGARGPFPKGTFLQSSYISELLQPLYEITVRAITTASIKNVVPRSILQVADRYNVQLFSTLARRGISIHLGGDKEKKIVMVLNKPWWSPFSVLPRLARYAGDFLRPAHFNIPADSGYGATLKFFLVRSLKYSADFCARVISITATYAQAIFRSAISFMRGVVVNTSSIAFETLAQTATAWSIFLIALPDGQFSSYKHDFSAAAADYGARSSGLENLANIQYELYIGSPLLMLVCVVGLLVALIGAALLVSTKVLNSK